jgi:outer membrane protein assembly factor BamA
MLFLLMRSIRNPLLYLFLFILPFRFLAVGNDTAIDRKVHFIPVPVFYYTPETHFAFGVGGSFTFKLSQTPETHYSQVLAIIAYTQRRQAILYFPVEIYSKDNNYFLDGDLGFFKYSYYYWGIGTARVPRELYDVRYPRITLNFYRKLFHNIYAGVDYNFERDIMLHIDPNGELATGLIPGSRGCRVSGGGITLLYDSRDSIFFPTKGLYIKIASFFNTPQWGSTNTFNKLTTEFSWYKQLSPSFILAMNQRNQFTYGDVPFNQLALIGGSKQMRGYYYGYYRDKFMTMLQAESRIHIHGHWGVAVFAASALIGNPTIFPDANGPIFAEGVGLRYNANTKQHINIRGDIGYGKSVEYYLSVEEAF